MSTSHDRLLNTLSRWLAGQVDTDALEYALGEPVVDLGPESAELVRELREELARSGTSRPKLQPLVRETIEAIAHGD
jgi:hypothetical protein